ncbi:MAG: dihydrolipoamide acetyltransferase family protein [Proteobacteria bacterium]|nr:dihydrolipoamide acetyltransferase family protein [Pseudomonadota bacterium]
MPQLGETVAEGTVTVWHKKVGDTVAADELLFEIGTDKVEMEIPASDAGVLTEIRVSEGETVAVGTVLAIIDDGKATSSAPAEAAPAEAVAVTQAASAHDASGRTSPPQYANRRLSPAVRKLVADNNLNPNDIQGSGREGRITRDDVLAFLKGAAASVSAPAPVASAPGPAPRSGDGRIVIPFNRVRKMTAEHMVRSIATSAHVLQVVETDFSNVDKARKAIGPSWKEREGFSLTYLPFIAKAVCDAMQAYPNINANVEGENLVVFDGVNLGIAVDLGEAGLVAPNIKDADRMTVPELARAISALAAKARSGGLTPDDLGGGTYTLSNNGSYGTVITGSIINQPQVAILSTDGIAKKPVVVDVDGEDMIAIRPVGMLAQSFDHRAIDGGYSAGFLNKVKEILETRDWRAAF